MQVVEGEILIPHQDSSWLEDQNTKLNVSFSNISNIKNVIVIRALSYTTHC
jgi:sporulation protein YlmC with PRC-barrel domain